MKMPVWLARALLGVAGLLLWGALPAVAQHGPGRMNAAQWHTRLSADLEVVLDSLALSAAQRAPVRRLFEADRDRRVRDFSTAHAAGFQAMRGLRMTFSGYDDTLKARLAALLSPEQMRRYEALLDARAESHQRRRGRPRNF